MTRSPRRTFLPYLCLLLAAVARPAGAQKCPGGAFGVGPVSPEFPHQDGCQKAIDLQYYMVPQLAAAAASGNAIPGSASALGGVGRFLVSIRSTGFGTSAPDVSGITAARFGRFGTQIPTRKETLTGREIDAEIGLFPGVPTGTTRMLGLDAIGSLLYIPEGMYGNVALQLPEGSATVGYGMRLGVMEQTAEVPGLGFTYLIRHLPSTYLTAATADGALYVDHLQVRTSSWRAVGSKRVSNFAFAAGLGADTYGGRASTHSDTPFGPSTPLATYQSGTVMNYFADASATLTRVHLTLEAGKSTAGDVGTFNHWSGKQPDSPHLFWSASLRFQY